MSNISLNEFISRWDRASKDFPQFTKRYLLKEAVKIRNEAANNTPVDTGALKASWNVGNEISAEPTIASVSVKGPDYSISIYNNMDYASFIEFGTWYIAPRYMVTLPMDAFKRNIKTTFSQQWKEYAKEKGIE